MQVHAVDRNLNLHRVDADPKEVARGRFELKTGDKTVTVNMGGYVGKDDWAGFKTQDEAETFGMDQVAANLAGGRQR